MKEILFLVIAGGLGTLGRYGLSGLAQRLLGDAFPFGTLLVNFLGSLLIGFIMQLGLNSDLIPRSFRIAITLGFLGAFTTFSTFSYETVKYIEDGAWTSASINIAVNVGICIFATLIGMAIGRLVLRGA